MKEMHIVAGQLFITYLGIFAKLSGARNQQYWIQIKI